MAGEWFDNFPSSAGGDWLSGLSDPYGSYTPDGLAGQLPNWYDRFPGAGAGGGDPLSTFLGGSGWAPNYGISDLGRGFAPPASMSATPLSLLSTPSFTLPQALSGFSGFGSFPPPPQALSSGYPGASSGFGGFGGSSMRGGTPSPYGGGQQGFGSQGLGGGYGGQQGYGGAQGYGQSQYGQRQVGQPGAQASPQASGYSGGTSNPAQVGGGQFASPLPPGGIYGAQKWSSPMGSNAVDIFVRRGTPVTAPVSGTLQQGANGQLILIGDNGLSFAFRHGQTTAQGHVQKGQQIGVVNDPGLDMLGQAPWGNMPDGYQHLELSVSNGNYFPGTPGGGGSIDAAQWLESIGYQGQKISKTPGPPDAQGGGGMGMGGGMGGLGGGMFGGGMGGGFPGMGGGMGGFPGLGGGMGGGMGMFGGGGMGGGMPGMGGGFGGFGGMGGGMSPFGGGGFGGGMGGLGGLPGMFGGFGGGY